MKKRIISKTKDFINKLRFIPSYIRYTFFWFNRDITHSSVSCSKESRLGELLIKSHVIEKGITMPNRRLGFGIERVRNLIQACRDVISDYGSNYTEVQATLKDLEEYLLIHKRSNYVLPDDIIKGINDLLSYRNAGVFNNSQLFTNKDFFYNFDSFSDFAKSRHTVRSFGDEAIPMDTILRAVRLAQTAPSACNRQSSRVFIISNKEIILRILKLQNGNRGFGDKADKLLLIGAEHGVWGMQHRTSAFLDAGIFIMNLLYALHEERICACTLNAQFSPKEVKILTDLLSLNNSIIPVAFIAIGYPEEEFLVARSERLDLNSICRIIE